VEKRTSFVARLVAVLALAVAVIVLIVAIASSLSSDSDSSRQGRQGGGQQTAKRHKTKAATYVVKSGDTLTAIAHRTGVPVAQILALNPEVDPQILIAGQTLKLR
jgi:LysM repeat protein